MAHPTVPPGEITEYASAEDANATTAARVVRMFMNDKKRGRKGTRNDALDAGRLIKKSE